MTAAQSVIRALKVLKLIMTVPDEGVRFTDLVKASGMDKSNVHRVLKALEQEAFIFRDPDTAAYHPLVSDHAENRKQSIQAHFANAVASLAEAVGDTVLLMSREGDHVVCIDRRSGDYPVKTLTTDIGQRRLMGIGSGGMCILSQLPDDEIAGFIERNRDDPTLSQIGEDALWAEIRQTRSRGYAVVGSRITPGTGSVGISVRGDGFDVALCVVSLTERIKGERSAWLVSEIQRAVAPL